MTAQGTAQLLARLGVVRSLGRPQVSDDNPYSEAQFKTLKYHPGFPPRFPDQDAATAFCRAFFPWYNTEHRHHGIAMLTPETVHNGRAQAVLNQPSVDPVETIEAWKPTPLQRVRSSRRFLPSEGPGTDTPNDRSRSTCPSATAHRSLDQQARP